MKASALAAVAVWLPVCLASAADLSPTAIEAALDTPGLAVTEPAPAPGSSWSSAPACGYPDCCTCEACGAWYFQAEAVLLQRGNGNADRPLVLADDTGATVLTTQDFDFDFEVGPRLVLGRETGGCGWELSYFGAHYWQASALAVDDNNLDIPGPIVAFAFDFDNADQMLLTYDSRLHNAEFNLLDERDTWTLLAGFRYLNLEERSNIRAFDLDDGDISDYLATTSNNLYGGQLGARTERWTSDRFHWELVGKAGIFGNDAQRRLLLQDNDNTVTLIDTTVRRGTVAFVGDVNLTGVYALNDVWSLRGGYYVMYAAGLALAPDQFDFTFDADTGTRITTGGDLLLHGANLGIEARW